MSTLLAVESASGRYWVAVGEPGGRVVKRSSRRDEPGFAGLGGLVDAALGALGGTVADVDLLAVDVGPGNLSSVRAAVAYVNGLAFSRGLKIYCASSLELLAVRCSQQGPLPALCLRKASGGNAYLGLYHGRDLVRLAYGPLGPTVRAVCRAERALVVAGAPAAPVAELLPTVQVSDSGIGQPDVDMLFELAGSAGEQGRTDSLAHPLTEASAVFHAAAPDD